MIAKLLALVIPLGLDSFAVAAALGIGRLPPQRRLRVSLVMTGFEVTMPLIGIALGASLGHAVGSAGSFIAIAILLAVAVYTLLGSDADEEERVGRLGDARGFGAVLLGLSISLDELAIGFTLGLLHLPIVPVIVLIGVQTFVFTQAGFRLGARLGDAIREGAERVAGAALLVLGLVLLGEKLFS